MIESKFKAWLASQDTVSLECRLGRHWWPAITDNRRTKHQKVRTESGSCWQLVQACGRGCGVVATMLVEARTGLVQDSQLSYKEAPEYLFTRELGNRGGRMDREHLGRVRLELIGRAMEED